MRKIITHQRIADETEYEFKHTRQDQEHICVYCGVRWDTGEYKSVTVIWLQA